MPTPKLRQQFVAALEDLADPAVVADVSRFFHADPNGHSRGNKVLGVSHGKIFLVAKRFIDMPFADIDRLLGSPYYEVRMGAVSIMDFQARAKRISPEHRRALFDLYLRRHDRINNWDLVDPRRPMSLAATSPTNRVTSYTGSRVPPTPGSAGPLSSVPATSSGRAMSKTRSESPSCWFMTNTSSSRRRRVRGFARPAKRTRRGS